MKKTKEQLEILKNAAETDHGDFAYCEDEHVTLKEEQ